jgi:hypothetical protein
MTIIKGTESSTYHLNEISSNYRKYLSNKWSSPSLIMDFDNRSDSHELLFVC